MRLFVMLACTLTFSSGCTSIKSLPSSANQVNFTDGAVGRAGWSEYHDVLTVRGIDRETAFLAAKEGLASAGFVVKKGDAEEGFVAGSRGMTAYDWNVVAGVYFIPRAEHFIFKVIAKGSRDFGFWGDATASSWPQDIFRGIRNYISTESSILDPDKNIFGSETGSDDGSPPQN